MDDILVSEMHNSIRCGALVFLHLDSQVWNYFNDRQGHGKLDSDFWWYCDITNLARLLCVHLYRHVWFTETSPHSEEL